MFSDPILILKQTAVLNASFLNKNKLFLFIFYVALWPKADHDLILHEVSRSHTTTDHTRQGFPGRMIKPSQRLYLTAHRTYNRQTSMCLAGFETRILTSDRPQTHALCRAASGIDTLLERLRNQFYNMNGLLIRDRVWSVVIW